MKKEKLGLKHAVLILAIFLIFTFMFAAINGDGNTVSKNQSYSIAYKLASIQNNQLTGYTTPSQQMINKFDNYLNSLVIKCKENDKTIIADYVVYSQELLKKDGVDMQLSEIISGMDQSIPADANNLMGCDEVMAAFVVLIAQ